MEWLGPPAPWVDPDEPVGPPCLRGGMCERTAGHDGMHECRQNGRVVQWEW